MDGKWHRKRRAMKNSQNSLADIRSALTVRIHITRTTWGFLAGWTGGLFYQWWVTSYLRNSGGFRSTTLGVLRFIHIRNKNTRSERQGMLISVVSMSSPCQQITRLRGCAATSTSGGGARLAVAACRHIEVILTRWCLPTRIFSGLDDSNFYYLKQIDITVTNAFNLTVILNARLLWREMVCTEFVSPCKRKYVLQISSPQFPNFAEVDSRQRMVAGLPNLISAAADPMLSKCTGNAVR